MGKTSPEEAKRLAIAALLRACFHCIVKIFLPHPVEYLNCIKNFRFLDFLAQSHSIFNFHYKNVAVTQ